MNTLSDERLTRRRLLSGGAAVLAGGAALGLVGCGDDSTSGNGGAATAIGAGPTPTPSKETPKKGGLLKGGALREVILNTGAPFAGLTGNEPLFALSETLIRYNTNLEPEKVLVERFEFNNDRTKLTFTLKPGLTFHNGAPVTVDDVFFGIDVINDPKKYGVSGTFQLATFTGFITDRRKVDQRTAELTFDKPRFNIADMFAEMRITHAASYPDFLVAKSVQGTGPFMWDSYAPKQSLRFKANPNWHMSAQAGGPYADAIEWTQFADADALGLAFESGGLDFALGSQASVAKRFRDKNQTRQAPKTGLSYVGCVVTNPLLKDKRVRQAMFLAIDRKRFAEEIGEGFSDITAQPWAKGSPAFDPALEAAFYDPAKAKSLLQQAGFRQDKPLKLEYAGVSYPTHAPALKENFEAIGVKIELTPLESGAFSTRFSNRQFPDLFISAHGFANLAPLTNFQFTFPYRVPNISYYEEPEYLQFIADLEKVDPSSPQALALYKTFNQKIWLESPWLLPFSGGGRIDLVGPNLRGFDGYLISPNSDPGFGGWWKKA